MRSINRKSLVLAAVATAVAGVLAVKQSRRRVPPASSDAQVERLGRAGLYLFLDDRDHDAGCERVYAAFEAAKAGLPADFETRRVDVEREPALAAHFGVKMLPTILIVGRDGAIQGRVEGEGEEAEARLRESVSRLLRGG